MLLRSGWLATIGHRPPPAFRTVTVSFFAAALSTWRAAHVAVPEMHADTVSLDAVVKHFVNRRIAGDECRHAARLVFEEFGRR